MGLLDCEKCWDHWCSCGHKYRDWSDEEKITRVAPILGLPPEILKEKLTKNINVIGKVEQKWVIMSKDREWIAKGTPRDRYLVKMNVPSSKRLMTYNSKGRAENAFAPGNWFYGPNRKDVELEAVLVEITMKEVKND